MRLLNRWSVLRTGRALALLSLVAAWAVTAGVAMAHGWYEPACCAGHDCWQIPDDAVKEVRSGWMVSLPGLDPFVIPFAEARPSGDEHFHICIPPGQPPRCLYAPPRGV